MSADAKLVVHDFWNRHYYRVIMLYFKCIARSETLGVFQRRQRIWDWPLSLMLKMYKTDWR
jgi:hypothetical protein